MKATVTNTPNDRCSYFVSYPLPGQGLDVRESITFTSEEWKSADGIQPKPGQIVILTGVKEFTRGWRAESASPVELEEPEVELVETTQE